MARKQSKYTKSARGVECQIRIPGVCNFNPETSVLAHLNGGGMATKHSDIHAAIACNDCHDVVDGRVQTKDFTPEEIKIMFLEGVIRTQGLWLYAGLLKI